MPQTIVTFPAADEGWKFWAIFSENALWEAWVFPVGTAIWWVGHFLLRGKRACVWIWTTQIAAILFSLGRDVASRRVWLCETRRDILCEFDYGTLAIRLYASKNSKVCPHCKDAVPVRRKTCERCDHVFRSKRKAECNLREKAMKRMISVESDSVKSARKSGG